MPYQRENKNDDNYGSKDLPLIRFYLSLKKNGFMVTTQQIAESNKIIAHFADSVKNEYDLCHYISPIFANSDEEQTQFREIFASHFGAPPPDENNLNDRKFWKRVKQYIKKHWWMVMIGLLVAAVAIFLFLPRPQPKHEPVFSLNDKNNKSDQAFFVTTNTKLETYISDQYYNPKIEFQSQVPVKYDWGDGTVADSIPWHIYHSEGVYEVRAFLDVYYRGHFYKKDTISAKVLVCNERDSILFEKSIPGDTLKVNEKITVRAVVKGNKPDSIKWEYAGKVHYGEQLEDAFTEETSVEFKCTAIYDSLESPCTTTNSFTLYVYSDKTNYFASIEVNPGSQQINPSFKVHWYWFVIAGVLLLVSFVLISVFALKWTKPVRNANKIIKDADKKYESILVSSSRNKPPFDLEFHNKNYLPLPEHEIHSLARQMRVRLSYEESLLNIPKTIDKTIHNQGFFQPVYVPRTLQSEYLVLIDQSNPNDQMVKLFDYLVDLLKKQDVLIDKYYYRNEPGICYNANEPNGISLSKLNEKHGNHILLVFGTAYQFLLSYYAIFNKDYLNLLRRWKYRAVITPVPVAEWTNKETDALNPEITVLPADVEGLILLMPALFSVHKSIFSEFKKNNKPIIEHKGIDFEEISDLKKYCELATWANIKHNGRKTNILFQWIASLAVYPKIRWELILAIGKKIMDKYDQSHQLNFTNLLHLARISWIREGQFPDLIRLDLLNILNADNEILARETVLDLIGEIKEDEVDEECFAYEEKMTQKIVNEFNLFAYDPEKYRSYQNSAEIFHKLWANNQVSDSPVRIYLKSSRNNLVNSNKKEGFAKLKTEIEPDAVDEYFNRRKDNPIPKKNIYLSMTMVMTLLCLFSLVGIILLIILNSSNSEKFPVFTYNDNARAMVRFLFKDSTGYRGPAKPFLNVGDQLNNHLYSNSFLVFVDIDNKDKEVSLTLGGEQIFDTLMPIQYGSYNILLNKRPGKEPTKVNIILGASCKSQFEIYKKWLSAISASVNYIDANSLDYQFKQDRRICVNTIRQGNNTDADLVKLIIDLFAKNNLKLTLKEQGPYPIGNREIQVYYTVPDSVVSTGPESARLPSLFSEIWYNSRINSYININLDQNIIYYSERDKNAYDSYKIYAVAKMPSGTYKVVTLNDQGYAVFFIRNVSNTSIGMSLCRNFKKPELEIKSLTENDCGYYIPMTLYYDFTSDNIYLPAMAGAMLVKNELAKLDRFGKNTETKINSITVITNSKFLQTPDPSQINKYLNNSRILFKVSKSDYKDTDGNDPFLRCYLEIDTTFTSSNSNNEKINQQENIQNEPIKLPVKDTLIPIKKSAENSRSLGRLSFEYPKTKSDSPVNPQLTDPSQQLLIQVAIVLKDDPGTSIQLKGYYEQTSSISTVENEINQTVNFLQENGIVENSNQVEVSMNEVNVLAKGPDLSGGDPPFYIEIIGINFPDKFEKTVKKLRK